MIANAIAECARLRRVMSDATPEDVVSLLTACTAGMSSRAVAQDFIETVTFISARRSVCSMMCGEAGVIPTILTALSAHGAVRPEMRALAAKGCGALGCMTVRHPPNADKIVSAGGLDVLYELMAAHADDQTVQKPACATLGSMVAAVSPASLAVIRAGRAVELLRAAKVRFPAEGSGTVSSWANRALDRLV